MEKLDTAAFKQKLLDEKKTLEAELKTLGTQNPQNPADWIPTVGARDVSPVPPATDPNEFADAAEELDENASILNELEGRLNEVNIALGKIDKGTYGVCEEDGAPIEKERLLANPAARTCKKHMEPGDRH